MIYDTVIRNYYTAWAQKDWNTVNDLLADGFTFSSSIEDHISKEQYKAKCWPEGEKIDHFDIERIFLQDNSAFVLYKLHWKNGTYLRNTEFLIFNNGKIKDVEVFFGRQG